MVQMPNTSSTGMYLTLISTITTNALSGMRYRFITDARTSSGMYLDRSVPYVGKNMPQLISNSRNAPYTIVLSSTNITTSRLATAATPWMMRGTFSAGIDRTMWLNRLEPSAQ